MNTFAQLQPFTSGVFHWNDLPVKKDNQREGCKIAEGTTNEFEYFEIHATTQQKGAVGIRNATDKPCSYFAFNMEMMFPIPLLLQFTK
ncbi:MAG: hypothetical protein SGI96_20295 [Bacteroidota bacterium]|nr:hypothetical protein [Bacteroidota bacterium]